MAEFLKTKVVCIVTMVFLFGTVSSHALTIFLRNSSAHSILYFTFPYDITYGPVPRGHTVKMPHNLSQKLAHHIVEVQFMTKRKFYSCGIILFNNSVTSIIVTPRMDCDILYS